jgi:cobalamin biosynthesis protein CobC
VDRPVDRHALPGLHALAGLEAAAAAHFGVEPRHVCAVPGSEVGLRIVGGLIGGPAHHASPAYRTHGEMIAATQPIAADALDDCDGTLILANPNNPDGHCRPRAQMVDLLDRRRDGCWLLVDEAFADADPAISLADRVGDARRLVVFRSFGKFFGLAGIRLGFVLGPAALIGAVRAALGAWPVSAAAIAIGTAAYRDGAWIAAMRARLRDDAAALDAVLARAGLRAIGDCPLFRLVETPAAPALFERLAAHAILTRPFADRPSWLRLGLPPGDDAPARLARALSLG